jgi:hypothetical protein
MQQSEIADYQFDEKPWQNKKTLQEYYVEREFSSNVLGDMWGCDPATVIYWIDKHGIEKRTQSEAMRLHEGVGDLRFRVDSGGYATCRHSHDGDRYEIKLHRLLAVSIFGFECVQNSHVHHKNEIPWLNIPDNIELMSPSEHTRYHNLREGGRGPVEKILSPDDDDAIRDLYEIAGKTQAEIADEYGVTNSTVDCAIKRSRGRD